MEISESGRRAREAVGALTEVNLIQIDLEDLVLRELLFDLEGHRDFIELARVRAVGREEEVSRDLLRDGRAPLGAAPEENVHDGRAQNPRDLHAVVLVKAVVFGREDRELDVFGNVLQVHEVAALLSEFADELPVGAPHAKRNLRTIVRKGVDGRELPVDEREDEDAQEDAAEQGCGGESEEPAEKAAESRGLLGSGARAGRSHDVGEERIVAVGGRPTSVQKAGKVGAL